jgi:hydroxymethylglutaryl-CoA lyase
MSAIDVTITEVGPRDGLQNTKSFMPTAAKNAWISAESAAGVRQIEVCSFVPAKLIPQFVDAEEVLTHANGVPGLSPAQAVEDFARMAALVRSQEKSARAQLVGACSTAFGCSLQGTVAEEDVVRVAVALREAGADAISLADTVGYANPEQVKRLFRKVRDAIGVDFHIEAHFHNTRGLGLANALAAFEVGIRSFDSTLGGLGGCPFAPGASGNVVTEDLVFMFESMGVRTGIDIEMLIAVRNTVFAALPEAEFYGHISKAGLPKGFQPLSRAA